MSKKEKLMYFAIAFIVGALVGLLFYGGLAKDEFGQSTIMTYILDLIIILSLGTFSGKFFLPIRTNQIIQKRKTTLRSQFRDMLDGLTTSLGAGNNINDSLYAVREDLLLQYSDDSFIIDELNVILAGIKNGVDLEVMLIDFGQRSGIEDIVSFGEVFKVAYRKGGNLQEIVKNTNNILADKIEIHEDIETVLTSNKNEQNLMLIMPILLIAMIKGLSSDFSSNYTTPIGIASTTFAIGMFALAYYLGKQILDINE